MKRIEKKNEDEEESKIEISSILIEESNHLQKKKFER
jgi:hypothetical protein